MRTFCIFLVSLLWCGTIALADEAGWYTGEVTFNSASVLTGEIRYDWRTDVVQYRKNGRVQAFGPHLLQSFAFFDKDLNTIRHFQSLRFARNNSYQTKLFFEVVFTGPLKLVRRPNQSIGLGLPMSILPAEDEDLFFQLSGYTYYVHTQNRFIDIKRFRKEIWPLMTREFDSELKEYMKKYQVSLHSITGKFRLINQYNMLKKPKAIVLL